MLVPRPHPRVTAMLLALCALGCSHHGTSGTKDAAAASVAPPSGSTQVQPGSDAGAILTSKGSDGGTKSPVMRRQWPSCKMPSPVVADDTDAGISPFADTCVIDEAHGVFADATRGDDATADGSRDLPYKSLQQAVAAAVNAHKHVYACVGTYKGQVQIGTDLSNGLRVFGGLSCDTFLPAADGAHSLVQLAGEGPALAIADTREVEIERVDFENIAGNHAPGTSYIAASVSNAHRIVLREVVLRAAAGEIGADGAPPPAAPAAGAVGNDGAAACAANPNLGGTGALNLACPKQTSTAGGNGGDGAVGSASGGTGSWQGFAGGGVGETDANWRCTVGNGLGPGPNMPYMATPGRGAKGFGALIGSRFLGFSGQAGYDGNPGQGGGGGGGAKAPASCAGAAVATGASAGGGGGGGCGGKGGKGGAPGGSSFGLVSVDSDVRMEQGAIAYGNGGKGGNGAVGQVGGKGGAGGKGGKGSSGSSDACAGSAGSDGADGGPGGGGNGGHAIGVLYLGRKPSLSYVSGMADAAASKGGDPGGGPVGSDPMLAPMITGTPGVSAFLHAM
jgi:hypothetical protein